MKIYDALEDVQFNETLQKKLSYGDGMSAHKFKDIDYNTVDPNASTVAREHPCLIVPENNIQEFASKQQESSKRRSKDRCKENDTNEVLCKFLKQQSAPEVDIDFFDGNPLHFRYFMAIFKEAVENQIEDPRGRLTRLIKYTKGEPKELVMNCIHQPPEYCYDQAKLLLEKRYGDAHRLLGSYRKEIKDWPPLKIGDAIGFRKFCNFLMRCQNITGRDNWNLLDNPDIICTLLSKLPGGLQDRWNRTVYYMRRKSNKEPRLSDLISFIDEETALLNDPLFSRDALAQYQEKKGKNEAKKRFGSFLTKTESNECQRSIVGNKKYGKCPMCEDVHDVEECTKFLKLSVEERCKMVYKKRLCYGCYKNISKIHNGKNCTNRRICKVCGEKHPTTMHGLKPKPVKNEKLNDPSGPGVTCASVKMREQVISMSVVPVKVTHEKSEKVINTFALLDNCSQGTFVVNDIVDKLGIQGTTTSITVKTINGDITNSTLAINGLKVKALKDHKGSKWIKISKAFSRDELPADVEDIATPEKILKWGYLDETVGDISQSSDIKIGLLIGANCSQALEPTKIIPSRDGGLYAFKTILLWFIVGPVQLNVDKMQKDDVSCHRISVHEAGSMKLAKHHFVIERSLKETDIKQILQKMF